jgi:hypothetical protein
LKALQHDEATVAKSSSGSFRARGLIAGLGDDDRTLEALDRMAALGAQRVGMYLNSSELASLRGDPRLSAFRKRLGLPVDR